MTKVAEDKIVIKQFKSGESSWWVNNKVYNLNSSNEVIFICGGISLEDEIKALESFILRNKKKYVASTPNIFAQEEKEWLTMTFGKHNGVKLDVIKDVDRKYLSWLNKEYSFKVGEDNLKQQIKEILGK